MTRLRFLCSLLCAAAVVTTAHAAADGDTPRAAWFEKYQQSRQGPEQTERFSQSYNVGTTGALDVQNLSGDVRVTTGRGNAIQIDAVKRVRHRDPDDARRLLSQLRIEVTQAGNRLEVRTIYPRVSGRGLSASVDYVITVPTNASVSLKSISGDISVSQVRGEVRAETTSGDVDVTATPNLALAKTVSGDVRASGIDAGRSVTLGTISGNVIASALDVRVLEAGTVSGDVQLTNVNVERLQARSTSGNIAFDSRLARGGRYELHAHSGNVRVMLASAMGFELDASTFSGSVRSDFPITLRSPGASQTGDRRSGMNRAIRGTYGDASAILSLRSFSGNVVITKK
jgi:DUF4097 and DUF4098 domain-containing protein YvlB